MKGLPDIGTLLAQGTEILVREGDRFLSPEELCHLLNVKPQTLRAWRYQGKGPIPFKLGPNTVRYAVSAVLSWLRKQEEKYSHVA